MTNRLYICLLVFTLGGRVLFSQTVLKIGQTAIASPIRFEKEINDFLHQDSVAFPPSGAWLFTGSSTIRKWENLKTDFNEIPVIQRGFGGSTMNDLNYYTDKIVTRYKPGKIIVYEGDNDLATGISPDELISQIGTFIKHVHNELPKTKIYFLSIKPSPSRQQYMQVQDETNSKLIKLISKSRKTYFIDIRPLMYDEKGKLRQDFFESDSLHITNDCYRKWAGYMKRKMHIAK